MATRREHYKAAEQILAEGEREVLLIRELNGIRSNLQSSGSDHATDYLNLTDQMDEAGKKAMGCWAQAQVHATLAMALEVVSDG